jgi:hypothetical protein
MLLSIFLSLTLVSFCFVQGASEHPTATPAHYDDRRLPTADYIKSQLTPTDKTAFWIHECFAKLYADVFEARSFSVERFVKAMDDLQVRVGCFLFGDCLLKKTHVKSVTQHWIKAFIYPLTHIGICALQSFSGGVSFAEHFYTTEWWRNERCKAALYVVRHLGHHHLESAALVEDCDFLVLQEKLARAQLEPITLGSTCN